MMPTQSLNIKKLEEIANQQGLLLLGVSDLDLVEDMQHFQHWLEQGMAADMFYMSEHVPVRSDPSRLLERAKSALVFASQYHHKDNAPLHKGIAKYAQFRDYHRILRQRIQNFAEAARLRSGSESIFQYRVCVDTIPLLERALARKTKGGFIGKNSCFISPGFGSFLLLGCLLIDQDLDSLSAQEPTQGVGCGTCKRCITHCPTGAIVQDRVVDARRCLSYWSIEHRGPIPREFWPYFNIYHYGCDICQDVCPFNRRAKNAASTGLGQSTRIPPLSSVAVMNQLEYEQWFGGTPMTRAKKDGLQRNALLALWASGKVQELNLALNEVSTRPDTTELLMKTVRELKLALEG